MYVHKTAKLCFLASPRTASRAVWKALSQPNIGFLQVGSHHDGPDQGYDIQGLTCFTTVRNHWDTVVSWWYNARMFKKERHPSLDWIAHHFAANRYYFRAGRMFWFREIPGIITLRYENLEAELNRILVKRGLPTVILPREGISVERLVGENESRHYSIYYNARTRNFVEWCFLPEIRELGYRFEEVPAWNA